MVQIAKYLERKLKIWVFTQFDVLWDNIQYSDLHEDKQGFKNGEFDERINHHVFLHHFIAFLGSRHCTLVTLFAYLVHYIKSLLMMILLHFWVYYMKRRKQDMIMVAKHMGCRPADGKQATSIGCATQFLPVKIRPTG